MTKPKVLIVEDDDVLLRLYSLIIEKDDSFEAVPYHGDLHRLEESVDWDDISVVVCDYRLGFRLRGSNILDWVKKHHPNIRRVMLTGDALLTIGSSNSEVMLLKPVTSDALIESLRNTNAS